LKHFTGDKSALSGQCSIDLIMPPFGAPGYSFEYVQVFELDGLLLWACFKTAGPDRP
jgi:hypothetical protein